MSRIIIVATTALVAALMAVWGTAGIIAYPQKQTAAPASVSIDVIQLTKAAKDLPVQQFDAY